MPALTRYLPTADYVRFAIVPAVVFIALMADNDFLLDFWHHLTRGREIVAHGRLLNEDVLTYTIPGQTFRDVNWLTQILYYVLYRSGGLDLVRIVNAIVLAAALLAVVVHCRQRCGTLAVAAGVGLFTFLGIWETLTIRPQSFSILFFALVYWSVDRSENRPWLLAVPPLVIGLWGNMHGAFPAGLMLVGGYLAAAGFEAWKAGRLWSGARVRGLSACLAASLAATLLNPYGWEIYSFVALNSSRSASRGITEWLPPGFDQPMGWFLLGSVLLVIGLHAALWLRSRRVPRPRDVLLLVCFGLLACRSMRMVIWWMIVTAPVLAELVAALRPAPQGEDRFVRRSPLDAVMLAAIVLAVVFVLPGLDRFNPLLRLSERSQPRKEHELERVLREIDRQDGPGRIFARFEWSNYYTWIGSPQYKVFMDCRIDIYPDEVWQEYVDVTAGRENWQQVLDRYRVDYLVLDAHYHGANGLLQRVRQSAVWRQTYQFGDEILVFVRQPRANPGSGSTSQGSRQPSAPASSS